MSKWIEKKTPPVLPIYFAALVWLVGGIALIAFYLSGARAGVVTIDTGVMILLVLIGCYCLYLASALGKLWKQKPGPKGKKK